MADKLNDIMRAALKERLGYTDEEVTIIENTPKLMEIIEKIPGSITQKMVITCIEATNCTYNKVGDKYVFDAFGGMIKDESCETPCLWAMSGFLPYSYMIYDRIASGLDPNGMHLDHMVCPDAGCRFGGFGSAVFKITVEDGE